MVVRLSGLVYRSTEAAGVPRYGFSSLGGPQNDVCKIVLLIGEELRDLKPRFCGKRFNLGLGELVGVFGVNRFPSPEIEGLLHGGYVYPLSAGAHQKRPDRPSQRVIISVVLPMREVKISA